LPLDVTCGSPGAVCCAGTECVQATPQPICLVPCTANTDCASNCCLEYGNIRGKVCAEESECANCAPVGQTCSTAARCCQGAICTTIDGATSCRKECKTPAECASNCCVLLGNDTRSVCLDARYCGP
jgi:hypothetical protein